MWYVYILKHPSEDRIYIGFSTDLRPRMNEHKSADRKWRLVSSEAHASEEDVRERERRLKDYGQVKQLLKKRITRSLQMV